MKYFPICIYTMKAQNDLKKAYETGAETVFTEKKLWRKGYDEFIKSRECDEDMLILFSLAEELSGIVYIGKILDIELDVDQNVTIYTFKMLHQLENPKALSTLKLLSTGNALSNNYIRPYAIVTLPESLENWISEKGIRPILNEKKTGDEKFLFGKEETGRRLIDFWKWAYSDIIGNTSRGILAEYIVASALGIDSGTQENWKSYDLDYNQLKLEIKSSAYLQSWHQNKLSQIRFSIRKTKAWNSETNIQDEISVRQSDFYIFCLLHHKVQETLNPTDLKQWTFYILETKILNREMENALSISLDKLKKMGAVRCEYDKLKVKIDLLALN